MRWLILLLAAGSLPAFKPEKHRDITEEALRATRAGFTAPAILEIQNANECVDLEVPVLDSREDFDKPCLPSWYSVYCHGCQKAAPNHFDDEALIAGSAQLSRLRQMFAESALAGHSIEARKLLGFALHAIQDFYSHSNWVELGNLTIFEQLDSLDTYHPDHSAAGVRTWTQPLLPGTEPVCSDGAILTKIAGIHGTVLTTGYFFKDGQWTQTGAPPGRCSHGAARPGIAKDDPDTVRHPTAVKLATLHSQQFVRSCLALLAGNTSARRSILGSVIVEANRPVWVADVKPGDSYYFDSDPFRQNLKIVWGFNSLFGMSNPVSSGPEGTTGVSSANYLWYETPPMPDVNVGALIGSIYSDQCPFGQIALGGNVCQPVDRVLIGSGGRVRITVAGKMYLHVNDSNLMNNRGHFEIAFTQILRARP